MDRQLALLATALCLVAAHGCKRTEHRKEARSFESLPTVEVRADADRARPSDQQDTDVPPSRVGDDERSRVSAQRWSPERWLAVQAAAAWSGKRDRPRPATPWRESAPTVEEASSDEKVATDGEAGPSEEASEPVSTAAAEAEDELALASSDDESSSRDEVAASSEEASLPSNADEELRRYVETVYGAGRGYTGVGAGEAGYTGMGAGEGFTGIGAGTGFTGAGAGQGFTGMFASTPATDASSTSTESGTAEQGPVVVFLPFFFSPMFY